MQSIKCFLSWVFLRNFYQQRKKGRSKYGEDQRHHNDAISSFLYLQHQQDSCKYVITGFKARLDQADVKIPLSKASNSLLYQEEHGIVWKIYKNFHVFDLQTQLSLLKKFVKEENLL